MTTSQTRLIHIAKRQIGLNDLQYRLILNNVGGVASSTMLDNNGFERVMACFEEIGFRMDAKSATYWRDKVASRNSGKINEREARKIEAMAALTKYKLPGLVMRISGGKTDRVEQLDSRQAYNLIETLKAIVARDGEAVAVTSRSEDLVPAEPVQAEIEVPVYADMNEPF